MGIATLNPSYGVQAANVPSKTRSGLASTLNVVLLTPIPIDDCALSGRRLPGV